MIVSLLYDPYTVLHRGYYHSGFRHGINLHKQLDFTNNQIISSVVDDWVISGKPDMIKDDTIGELKTYVSNEGKGVQHIKGKAQANIYGFLAQVSQYRLVLYDATMEKVTYDKTFRVKRGRALSDIRKAIKKWTEVCEALNIPIGD